MLQPNFMRRNHKSQTTVRFINSGPYKKYTFGNVTLTFSHRSDSQMTGMSEKTLLLIQALKAIGQDNVSEADIKVIRKRFSSNECQTILSESRYTTRIRKSRRITHSSLTTDK